MIDASREPGTASNPHHRYRAYGLAIHSDIALPELEPDTVDHADLAIRLRPITRPSSPEEGVVFEIGENLHYLAWPRVGRFLIRNTHEIDVDPAPGVAEPLLRLPLLGTVLALLLHLRNQLVLHASAVAIGDKGVVFVGDKTTGKSTTAAAFVRSGYDLLADDVVAIDFAAPTGPLIKPGFPQIKLDAGAAIGSAVAMPPVAPGYEKRQYKLLHYFARLPVRPARVYVLERGTRVFITRLPAKDALNALIRFSYVARFGSAALGKATAGPHLRQCAELVGVANVCRLEVPDDLDRLRDVVRLVEADLQ